MGCHAGISHSTVQRIWKKNDLKPHIVNTFKLSNDPKFEEKLWDVTGLYLDPPAKAHGRLKHTRPPTELFAHVSQKECRQVGYDGSCRRRLISPRQ